MVDDWADARQPAGNLAGGEFWRDVTPQAPLSKDEVLGELKGAAILLLIGLGFLAGSGLFLALNLNYFLYGQRTEGVVVRLATKGSRRGAAYAPVVAYTVNGEQYRMEGSIASGVPSYQSGDRVAVLYLPDDPEEATIADFTQLYLFPSILGGLGLVVVAGGFGLGAYTVRKAGWRLLPASR
jgi:Protein of unknown function (DUF3592)